MACTLLMALKNVCVFSSPRLLTENPLWKTFLADFRKARPNVWRAPASQRAGKTQQPDSASVSTLKPPPEGGFASPRKTTGKRLRDAAGDPLKQPTPAPQGEHASAGGLIRCSLSSSAQRTPALRRVEDLGKPAVMLEAEMKIARIRLKFVRTFTKLVAFSY
jgi:hypothetical protein